VSDGPARIRAANRERIEAEVRAELAAEIAAARGWRRLVVWWRVRAEIRRKLAEIAPPHGNYTSSGLP